MLTETGQIITLDGKFALVDVQRKSSCQSCAAKAGCGTSILGRFFEKRLSYVKALNEAMAAEGDMVELELNESSLVFMTFWIYLFPILFMFVVIVVITLLTSSTTVISIGAVGGLMAGIYISRLHIRNKLDASQLHPVVRRVVLN